MKRTIRRHIRTFLVLATAVCAFAMATPALAATKGTLTIRFYANGAQKNGTKVLAASQTNNQAVIGTWTMAYGSTKASQANLVTGKQSTATVSKTGLPNFAVSGNFWQLKREGYSTTVLWHVGSASSTKTVNANTKYASSQALAKALGVDLTTGNKVVNLYAKWTPNVYRVAVEAGEGIASVTPKVATLAVGESVTISFTKEPGYFMSRWTARSSNGLCLNTDVTCGGEISSPIRFTLHSAADTTIYLTPSYRGILYRVEHWVQKSGDAGADQNEANYKLYSREFKYADAGATVTPQTIKCGYVAPPTQTVTVAADGSTVVRYYYEMMFPTFPSYERISLSIE